MHELRAELASARILPLLRLTGLSAMSGSIASFAVIVASFAALLCVGTVLMVLVHAFRR
jgi:hypothetical protein